MSVPKRDFLFGSFFLSMHTEKNEGGTRNLILRGNELIDTIGRRVIDEDILRISMFLRSNKDIAAVELPYNEITSCGLSSMAEFLMEVPSVRHLNLLGNNVNFRGVEYLASLRDYLNLYSLRLTGNKFGDLGGEMLSKLLYKNTPLKYLDLSDTHQGMHGLAHILTALMPGRGGTDTLQYLDIGRPLPQPYHQVDDQHLAHLLSQVFADNKNLKEIHLQQFQLDSRDVEIIMEGLMVNSSLVCLDLNNNNIGVDGVKYLCRYLELTPPLECLMIGANGIGDHGATYLSRSLPFSKIRLLDITNNRITDEGMIHVFYTIQKTEQLRALFIWGNVLTHKSLTVLERFFSTGLLDPEHTDVRIYCRDDELHMSWNYQANRYTHRFYCVADYARLYQKEFVINPHPPAEKPPIYYKYHTDNNEIGFPMCEWE